MAGIRDIRKLLDQYPEIEYQSTDLDIVVPAKEGTGYDVTIAVHMDEITVYYDGWHKEFQTFEEAIPYFIYGLTPFRRLLVHTRGEYRYKWELEVKKGESWSKSWIIALFLYPFWRSHGTLYLRNHHLTDENKIQEIIDSLVNS